MAEELGNDTDATSNKNIDVGHKYATRDPKDRNAFTCKFCRKVVKGGVYRIKEHLHGGFSNVRKCSKCPEHVREEVKQFMMMKRAQKDQSTLFPSMPQYDDYDLEEEQDCMEINQTSFGSGSQQPTNTSVAPRKRPRQMGPMDVFFKANPDNVLKGAKGGTRQQTINEVCKKELRGKVCKNIARWFYDTGIPFNAATYDSFAIMIESIGQFGPGMKPPSMHELRVPLLKNEVDEVEESLVVNKREWKEVGCSIMSDGWRDLVVSKDIINFLVNSPKGSVFVKSTDVSSVVKDANMLFKVLDDMVEEVGEENVVQVVTDNASAYVKAGRMLEAMRPHLYWTPCAAHCLDLMLEDIGKLAKVKATLKKAMFMNAYIYNHVSLVNMMRRFTNQRNLHRPAVTRFATSFITLSQIHTQKNNLRKMITSSEWTTSKFAKEVAGKKVQATLIQESFWRDVVYTLKLTGPLVRVLRLVDGEKTPAMGYIFSAMDCAKNAIAESFGHVESGYKEVFEIINKRWECQLHRPLHAAGYFLNPAVYYEDPDHVGRELIMEGLYDCISRLSPTKEIAQLVGNEITKYQNAEGVFGKAMAIGGRSIQSPADWWSTYGASAPNLKKFAIRVLSLTCSATGCERNWGVFQDLHTKKRNRLAQERLNDLVFVKYNRALRRRSNLSENRLTGDMIWKDIDESNEWLIGRMEDDEEDDSQFVFQGEDLTWPLVDEAMGVNEPIHNTRGQMRGASNSSRSRLGRGRQVASSSNAINVLVDVEEELEEDIRVTQNDLDVIVDLDAHDDHT